MQISKNEENIEEIINEFDEMVGMEDIKNQLVMFLNAVEINQKKYKAGKTKELPCMNLRFVGPAGTGKTTVAKILGRLFCAKKILSNPEPVIKKAGDYYSGGHVDVMKSMMRLDFDSAKNGIILIDEFYNFNKGHSFGNLAMEALEVIKGAAVDYRGMLCIIIAGYEYEVNETFAFNVGCKRRFPYEIKFRDYSTDELMKTFIKDIIKLGYTIDEDAQIAVAQIIDEKKANKQERFENARYIKNLLIPKICSVLEDGTNIAIETVKEAFPFEASLA